MATRNRGLHDPCARVGDQRRAGVRYERHVFATVEPFQNLAGSRLLVVRMCRIQRCLERIPAEQNCRPPRVLSQYAIYGTQYFDCAVRDVSEIPDGSADNIELGHTSMEVP